MGQHTSRYPKDDNMGRHIFRNSIHDTLQQNECGSTLNRYTELDIRPFCKKTRLCNMEFQPLPDRSESKCMLAEKSRFDGISSNVETSWKIDIRHLERTTTNRKNVVMNACGSTLNRYTELGIAPFRQQTRLFNMEFQPVSDRSESKCMLAKKRRFDGHSSNVETSGKIETRHLKRTTTNGKNVVMTPQDKLRNALIGKTRDQKFQPFSVRPESKSMLADNDRFDGNSRNVDTPGIMETCHLERTTNNGKNVVMMESDIRRIVVIGKTGAGKSTLGNTLLGEKRFSDFSNFQPLSDRAESKTVLAENSLFGRKICLVDTPGLFDTRFPPEQVKNEIRRCFPLTTPGPHAIILTVKASRLTKEDIEVFKTYTDMFGESMLKYTVVVFTHFDHWKQIEGKTRDEAIEDFIKSFPETVNQFLKRIKNRYVMLDTKGKDVEDETKALIFAIEQMITDNKNGFYSYQHFIDSRQSQLRAEGLVADLNRRQKKKKNRRQLTSSFLQNNIKRTRSSFERETDASMVPNSKRRCNCRA